MRVLIVEDEALLREGLASLFRDGGHEIVAALGDAEHLLAAVGGHRPDLVVIDVRMPPTMTDEGARAAVEIKQAYPEIGVLVLSAHVETMWAVSLLSLEGVGYLLKDRVLDVAEFLSAAQRVADGGSALDPVVMRTLLLRGEGTDPLAALSEREREVLQLMASGLTNAGIARELVVTERTVEAHVRQVLMKLDLPQGENANRRVLAVLAHLRAVDS